MSHINIYMNIYNNLLAFGDKIKLRISCNPEKLLDEIKDFPWHRYNPRKEINRYGLSVTSLDGQLGGIDLDSLYEYNKLNNTNYNELSFKTKTEVYHKSKELQKIIQPLDPWVCRTHVLKLSRGGYFPPHRDWLRTNLQESFRLIMFLRDCIPPSLYFIYDGSLLNNLKQGKMYFLNTNKEHSLFSFSDEAMMLVINLECTEESINRISELIIG
jgi:hypothetical protein